MRWEDRRDGHSDCEKSERHRSGEAGSPYLDMPSESQARASNVVGSSAGRDQLGVQHLSDDGLVDELHILRGTAGLLSHLRPS